MILGRYLWTELGLNLKIFEHIIKANDGPFIVYTVTMVDLGVYIFKYLNIEKIEPEISFTDAYAEEIYISEHARTSTKRLRVTLDAKHKKSDWHKVMETQC